MGEASFSDAKNYAGRSRLARACLGESGIFRLNAYSKGITNGALSKKGGGELQ